MTLEQMKEKLRDMTAVVNASARKLADAANDSAVPMAEVTRMQNELTEARSRRDILENECRQLEEGQRANTGGMVPRNEETPRDLKAMLGSNEYARAFAYALRRGLNADTAREDEKCKVLMDALTIGGGTPEGSNGGFLVPEDVDNRIRELRREQVALSDLFTVEEVSTNSGWRVTDTDVTGGMTQLDEMAAMAAGAQPKFQKVTYTLQKYGLLIPVSAELASDEVANLFAYLGRFLARHCVNQENSLLLTALSTLTATDLTEGKELSGVKNALNKALDPAIAQNAVILTNQTGFDILDNLVDGQGRPLIHMDLTTGTPKMLGGRTVKVVSDTVLANAASKAPVYIGDFRQYATLFRRSRMQVNSTNVGGDAWRTDSIEVRGLVRMCVSKFDTAAAVKRTIGVS